MEQESISEIVKVAICICAEDGIVSQSEENLVYKLVTKSFPEYSQKNFNDAVDDFFSSEMQLEDYLSAIKDPELQKLTLDISMQSAAIDGLDFRENIAVQKAKNFWKLQNE